MKKWLHVARDCGCSTPDECSLFPAAGEADPSVDGLELVHIAGDGCRRRSSSPTP
jgi:hypothetical protein